MELVVLSGKGGTGKTTISMAFGEMLSDITMIDCDVDAPNLNLFFNGEIVKKEDFYGEKKAVVDSMKCTSCGICTERCKFEAIVNGCIDLNKCEGCGVCKIVCPEEAIEINDIKNADIYIQKKRNKDVIRSDMRVGSEGSGKLVTKLRKTAAENTSNKIKIIDGSPGIGCQVLASSTGCSLVLIVTEPSMSGLSDLKRIHRTINGLNVKSVICVNKYDLNNNVLKEIKKYCNENEIEIVGLIPFDSTVIKAINNCKSITLYENSIAAEAIKIMWGRIKSILKLGSNKINIKLGGIENESISSM